MPEWWWEVRSITHGDSTVERSGNLNRNYTPVRSLCNHCTAWLNCRTFECGRHRHWWHGEEKSDQEQTPLFWIKMWSNDLLELARGFSSWAQMSWHLRSFSYFCLCFPTNLSTLNVTALQRWCHYRHTRLRLKLQMWAQHTQTSRFYLNRVCLLLLQLAFCFIFIIKIAASVVSV